jgi:DNA-binding transcriptional MerR regulator
VNNGRIYWPHEIAGHLNIADSTLRKWAISLESKGYQFRRDDNGNRAYGERDRIAFSALRDQLRARVRLEEAASYVAGSYPSGVEVVELAEVPDGFSGGESLTERMNDLETKIDWFMQRMQVMEEERERAIERRDEAIMAMMRQLMESRAQAVAAQKRAWWQRLFLP